MTESVRRMILLFRAYADDPAWPHRKQPDFRRQLAQAMKTDRRNNRESSADNSSIVCYVAKMLSSDGWRLYHESVGANASTTQG